MSIAEANVLIAKLETLRRHHDRCYDGVVCRRCNEPSDTFANTCDDAIVAIRKLACT